MKTAKDFFTRAFVYVVLCFSGRRTHGTGSIFNKGNYILDSLGHLG